MQKCARNRKYKIKMLVYLCTRVYIRNPVDELPENCSHSTSTKAVETISVSGSNMIVLLKFRGFGSVMEN